MSEKPKFARRLMQRLEAPTQALGDGPRITISDGRRVLVEGHRGLIEYADDRIEASGRGCKIRIRGEGLCLDAMSAKELVASGKLWAVEFE